MGVRPCRVQGHCSGIGSGEATIEPDFNARQGLSQGGKQIALRAFPCQGIQIGDVQRAAGAVLKQRARHVQGRAARAQLRHHGAVAGAVATDGAHHLTVEKIDDRHDLHKAMRMTRVLVYEYTTAEAQRDAHAADLSALGRQMRDAMVADLATIDGVQVSCVAGADETAPLAWQPTGSAQADIRPGWLRCAMQRVTMLSPRPGERAVDLLAREARAHDLAWVVAPESDGILASLRAVVDDDTWLGSSLAAIECVSSKRETARLLAAAGIPTTRSIVPGDAAEVGFTHWVVKPDDGAGSLATHRHADYSLACEDYLARLARGERAVWQGWVEGEPMSISLLVGVHGADVLSVNRQQIRVADDGTVGFDGVAVAAVELSSDAGQAMTALGRQVAAAVPGLAGFVGVDAVWHPTRGAVAIEVNPRVTCAYAGMSARLHRNIGRQVLALHRVGRTPLRREGQHG